MLPEKIAQSVQSVGGGREFRALTGFTPLEYVRLKRGGDATLRSVPAVGVMPPHELEE